MIVWTHVIGWALIHFMWQGTALGILAAVALRLLQRKSPQSRYLAACTALGAMLVLPPITCVSLAKAQTPSAIGLPPVSFDAAETLSRVAANPSQTQHSLAIVRGKIERLLPIVVWMWLAGVLFFAARLGIGWWQVRRLHKHALSRPASRLQHLADVVAKRIGLRRIVHIVDSDLTDTPTAVGWIRPAILVPVAAFAQLSVGQVEAILAHELSHVRRHDYLVNLLQAVAEVFLFYHPAVWWLSSRIRCEREHCCDDVAVGVCGDAVSYVKALKALEETRKSGAERTRQPRLVFAATGRGLLGRAQRMLRVDGQRSGSSGVLAIALVVALLLIVAGRDRLKAVTPGSAIAYQTGAEPAFRSTSIKTVPALTPQSPGLLCGIEGDGTYKAFGPGTFLISCAYGIPPSRWRQQVVGAPDWLDDDLFEIDAQAPRDRVPASQSDGLALLRRLLADEFKLAVHRETKDLDTFELVVARSDGTLGPQMRRTPPDCAMWIATRGQGNILPKPSTPPGYRDCGFGKVRKGLITNTAMPMSRLTNLLTPLLGRIVRDMTGLPGYFDLDLQWTPEKIAPGSPVEHGPALTTALRTQLGLTLEVSTSTVDLLVIDHVERPKTE